MSKHSNKIDWLPYHILRWWWNPIQQDNPALISEFASESQVWMWNWVDDELMDDKYKRLSDGNNMEA